MKLSVTGIRTKVFYKKDSLEEFLLTNLEDLDLENNILAITSKIVSISENQYVSKKEISKSDLVKREADQYLGVGGYGVELTIKHGLLIPSAGIDESNSESDEYILYPKNPYQSAERVYKFLKKKLNLKNFGILITDSHTLPLRKGVTGVALSYWGFEGVKSRVGQKDIFEKPLKFTHIDVVDALAAMAVYVMGEADERMPLAILENTNVTFTKTTSPNEIKIELENDLYAPLLKKEK